MFARPPQVQERWTEEIASVLDSRLQPAGVMVGAGFADARARRELLARIRGVR